MHGRAGRILVVSEVALSLVLLVGAGLLVHSFARVQHVEPGFDARSMLTLRLSLPESRYTTFDKGDRFFDTLFAALRARPDVQAVAAASALPFSGNGGSRTFHSARGARGSARSRAGATLTVAGELLVRQHADQDH